MGLTSAVLKSNGISPSERVLSNKSFKGFAKVLDVDFKNLGWRLSGPGDLFGFKLKRAFSISDSDTVQLLRNRYMRNHNT